MSASRLTATSRILFIIAPVPAGISRPTMTFSLSPSSVSALPLTAASVSTRVVSWNDAAEMNERVCSEALVMPSSTGCAVAGFLPSAPKRALTSSNSVLSTCSPWIRSVSPEVVDLHLLQHLPYDHFDVLIVDGDALKPIDVLDLVDEVACELLDALDRQDVVRRRVAFDDVVALFDEVAVLQVDVLAFGDEILPTSSSLLAGSIVMRRLFL